MNSDNINNNYTNEPASPVINTENTNPTAKLTAIALYDYQAADSDELSFDPNDIITDIVQVIY